MKKVGILSRTQLINGKEFIGCYINYINKLKDKVQVYIIPFNHFEEVKLMDGLVAPGGDNVSDFDRKVFDYAINNDIPYLGICLGMQVMGNLDKVDNHYLHQHFVNIKKDSLLYKIYKKDKISVNSRHHEKVINTNYNVCAISDDGVIEGIEVKDKKFILGVQWHPEDLSDSVLFDYFINVL